MVISEMILSNSLLWEYFPNINQSYFPFPLLKVNFFKYFGEAGGLVAIIVFWCALSFSVLCIIELTIMRCAITYNFQTILKCSRGIPFVIVQLGEVIIVFAVALGFCSQLFQGMHGFEQFVIQHNVSYILKEFDVEHDVVTFFDLDSPTFRPLLFFIIALIIVVPFVLSGLTYFTHRKIMREAHRMSTENRSLQTRLTALLLAQILRNGIITLCSVNFFTFIVFICAYSPCFAEETRNFLDCLFNIIVAVNGPILAVGSALYNEPVIKALKSLFRGSRVNVAMADGELYFQQLVHQWEEPFEVEEKKENTKKKSLRKMEAIVLY